MRHKICLLLIGLLFAVDAFSQVYASKITTVFPNSDSAYSFEDTLTVTINQEAGTIQITIKNYGSHLYMINDTMIMSFNPHSSGLTLRNGMCSYTIRSIDKNETSTKYYINSSIYYVEVREKSVFIAFRNEKNNPIMLTKF